MACTDTKYKVETVIIFDKITYEIFYNEVGKIQSIKYTRIDYKYNIYMGFV